MRSHHSHSVTIIGILLLVAILLVMPVTAMDLPFIRPFPAAGSNTQPQLNEISNEIVSDTGPWQTWSKDDEFLENISGSLVGMPSVTAPTLIKQKCFGGSQDENSYHSIRQTSDGGYVLTTSYSLSNDGDVSGNHGKKDIWIAKLRNELGVLDRMTNRIEVIIRTDFIPAAYALAEVATGSVILLLLFIKMDPYLEGIIIFAVICSMLIGLLLLIRDMDNPFEIGSNTYADVDLETLTYLTTYFDEQDAEMESGRAGS